MGLLLFFVIITPPITFAYLEMEYRKGEMEWQ